MAFARLPCLRDEGDAYRLFLAEKALDAGLSPNELMREMGYTGAIGPMLKGGPDQPRVPKGNGRQSGEYAGRSAGTAPAVSGNATRPGAITSPPTASIIPVLLDTTKDFEIKEREERAIIAPEPLQDAIAHGHPLDAVIPRGGGLPFPLPAPAPSSNPDYDKDGPACPAMRDDRLNGISPVGDDEEYRIAQLVNPSSPTPKQSSTTPNVTSQAYYLPLPDGREVSNDDCKSTSGPSLLEGLNKGDLVEVETVGSASLILIPGLSARGNYEDQLKRQVGAIKFEGKGRHIFTCVGSEYNVREFNRLFHRDFPEAIYSSCKKDN